MSKRGKMPAAIGGGLISNIEGVRKYMKLHYDSIAELVELATENNTTISRIVLEEQARQMEKAPEEVYQNMENCLSVMEASIKGGLDPELRSSSGLSGGSSYRVKKRVDENKNLYGHLFGTAMYMALAVSEYNSAMGQIVAAPTAGSCGILPAALISVMQEHEIEREKVVMAMFTASAVGMVIAKNASISGAEGGCQAECGSASAMAAAALTELMGGTPEMAGHSCAIALKNILGLVCDPVAGLVEVPCIKRNAMGVANAFTASELASAGVTSAIPADEVIIAMKKIGNEMSASLKETAEGGLAATPTGCRLCKKIFSKE